MVEQFWWNSGTVMLEQCRWNNVGGTLRWKSGTVWWKVEQFWLNSETVMVEQCGWNSVVEQSWWNSETVMLEQCTWNSDAGTLRCNSAGERV